MENKNNSTTDYKYGDFDEKGNLRPSIIRKNIFYVIIWSILLFITSYILLTDYVATSMNVDTIYTYENFFRAINIMYLRIQDSFLYQLILFVIWFLSTSLVSYFYYLSYIKIKFKADVQAILSSIGVPQYSFKKFNKKTRELFLTLERGSTMNIKPFRERIDDICQMFQIGDFESSRVNKQDLIIKFKEIFPDITNAPKEINYTSKLVYKLLLLGISDILGRVVYTPEKEEGNGQFNGHWLIVGGSGSGKSFFIKELLKSMLLAVNYLMYDKIYIINYKGSSDYNFLKKLKKVEYADDIASGLRILKKVQLSMFTKYHFNNVHNTDNFLPFQTFFLTDEIQRLLEELESKSISKIKKNSIIESLSIYEQLGSKSRAANITLCIVLQKGDVNSLPSTAFRSNLRNRVMLKQENISSAHLVVNKDVTERENINPLELMQGQFIYWDMLTQKVIKAFAVMIDLVIDYDELNSLEYSEEEQAVLDELESYKEIAIEAIKVEAEIEEQLEADGKKTYYDTFEDAEKEKTKDAFAIAEERVKERRKNSSSKTKLNLQKTKEVKKQEVKTTKSMNIKTTKNEDLADDDSISKFQKNLEEMRKNFNEEEFEKSINEEIVLEETDDFLESLNNPPQEESNDNKIEF